MYIKTEYCVYPIEVKIYAMDQDKQVYRYFCCANKEKPQDTNKSNEKNTVFYLTLNGSDPSDDSLFDLKNDFKTNKNWPVKCISFSCDILNWLITQWFMVVLCF